MKKRTLLKLVMLIIFATLAFTIFYTPQKNDRVRSQIDTVGFASNSLQLDSFLTRVQRLQGELIHKIKTTNPAGESGYLAVISPHDDYSYVGYLYPALLDDVKAPLVIMFGVAHKASRFDLEDKIVFGRHKSWKCSGFEIPVSPLQQEIIQSLPHSFYTIHDDMMEVEHSLEAIVPFLYRNQPQLEIIPILVPYMSFDRMLEISKPLAKGIAELMRKYQLEWGRHLAIVISNDAVHYGDEDWGGKNYARYGVDLLGYASAIEHEQTIIQECLVPEISPERIRKFTQYTVQENNFRQYKWTWCGRYAVPLGLLTVYELAQEFRIPLTGKLVGYHTSIDFLPIPVEDLGMGVTAPANLRHWVGYAAIGYIRTPQSGVNP